MPVPATDPRRPTPDRAGLDPGACAAPGWRVEVLGSSPSTNAELARRARDGESAGLVLAAEHQTAGRGRLDRVWVTPARAALTFSLLVDPVVPMSRWPWLPLLTGLAVRDAVIGRCGLDARLKWPNDVLVEEQKVAGILVELVEPPGSATGPLAVVGIGINVSSTREELPVPTATSLALAGATSLDRSLLLSAVLTACSKRYDAWRAAAGAGPRAAYAEACSTVGRRVQVQLPGGDRLEGLAAGVDADGRLEVDDGTRVHVLGAGDVVHVRPAGGAR